MVADHYARVPDLAEVILAAYGQTEIGIDDLAPVDEFHLGGAAATAALTADLGLHTTDHVLDIGCGIGGPARRMAALTGCLVSGIDLTPSFVAAATALTKRVGLTHKVEFSVGDASELAAGAGFGAATLIHVGMNIADKRTLFAAVHEALAPGARFGVYDIMRVGEGDIALPQPFASEPGHVQVESPAHYIEALEAAGFAIVGDPVDRTEMALQAAAAAGEKGPPPASLATLMGPDFMTMFANLGAAVRGGVLAPVQIIATC